MKVAISIADDVFESAETLGKRLGVSRNRLYAMALAEFVAKHRDQKITDRLNSVYRTEDSTVDATTTRLQQRSIDRESW